MSHWPMSHLPYLDLVLDHQDLSFLLFALPFLFSSSRLNIKYCASPLILLPSLSYFYSIPQLYVSLT